MEIKFKNRVFTVKDPVEWSKYKIYSEKKEEEFACLYDELVNKPAKQLSPDAQELKKILKKDVLKVEMKCPYCNEELVMIQPLSGFQKYRYDDTNNEWVVSRDEVGREGDPICDTCGKTLSEDVYQI